jgi:hypothetical protein
MKAEGNNIFSYTAQMMPGDNGAYYFMNKNAWGSRETVPAECAKRWNSDREYIAPDHDTIIGHPWGSCAKLITSSKTIENERFLIFPNPLGNENLNIVSKKNDAIEQNIEILTLDGRKVLARSNIGNHTTIERSLLKQGVYIVRITSAGSDISLKLVAK